MSTQQFPVVRTTNQKIRVFLESFLGYPWPNTMALIVKAILYRIFSMIVTFLVAFLMTNDASTSMGVSLLDLLLKTIMYYTFDMGWNTIHRKL